MNTNTKFEEAQAVSPVVIEQVFAEKPGGGRVSNPDFEVKQGTAVYQDGTMYKPIKAYRVAESAADDATEVKVVKGSGVKVGDFVGTGKKAVAVDAVAYGADNDTITLHATLGVELKKGAVLYQAKSAGTSAVPVGEPKYIVGNDVPANEGDYAVRLVNGCNLRKETAPVAPEVVALMKSVELV